MTGKKGGNNMDAIKFLLTEHRRFRKMLSDISKGSPNPSKKRKFKALSLDLTHHEKMEQKVWYPFLKKNMSLSKRIKHLTSEEKSAAKEIKQVKKKKTAEKWYDEFIKLKKDVLHHAKEEETKLFPKVRKTLNNDELKKIGKRMQTFKYRLDHGSKKRTASSSKSHH
jgi:hemerythrin superfamily protein